MNKLLTKIVGAALGLTMTVGVGVAVASSNNSITKTEAALGDEITNVSNIVSGNDYYIKGVRSSNTYYLTFTDATGSQSGTESSTTNGAVKLTFTAVTGGYNISTPNGNYIAPGTANGKINVSASPILVSASNQSSKIRLSITSGGNTWSIQKNSSAANFGGYKNTQADITLIDATSGGSVTNHTLTYAAGEHGTHDGSTPRSFEVQENTSAIVKTPAQVGISANSGYSFAGWSDGTNTYQPNASYPMGTTDHTLTAQWNETVNYTLVTDDSALLAGTTFILLHESEAKAAGAISNSIFPLVDATVTSNQASSANATVFTLGGSAGSWTIHFDDVYLGKESSSGTSFNTSETVTTGCHWTISISNSKATIKSESSGTRAISYNYNNGNSRFGPYTPSDTYTLPRMFAIIPAAEEYDVDYSGITNGTASGDTTIKEGGSATVTIAPNTGYKLPSSVSVSGASHTYNSTTGVVTLTNPTDDVTVTATCPAATLYTISTSLTGLTASGDTQLYENGTATVTLALVDSSTTALPTTIEITNAVNHTYNSTTGVISINGATGNVTITASAVAKPSSLYEDVDVHTVDNFVEVTANAEYRITQGLFTLTWSKGSASSFGNAYSPIRLYHNNLFTISGTTGSGGVVKITSVVFHTAKNGNNSTAAGTSGATTNIIETASGSSIAVSTSEEDVTYTMSGTVTSFSLNPSATTWWSSITINYLKDNTTVDLTSISANDLSVLVSQQVRPAITFNPQTASNKNVTYSISAATSAYASVDGNGVVTGLSAGTAKLTITPADTHANPITIDVVVSALPSIYGVEVGKEYAMTNGSNQELSGFYTAGTPNYGTVSLYSDTPEGTVPVRVVNGLFAHTVALQITIDDTTQYISYDSSAGGNGLSYTNSVNRESSWIFSNNNDALEIRNVESYHRFLCYLNGGNNSRFACYQSLNENQYAPTFVEIQEVLTDYQEVERFVSLCMHMDDYFSDHTEGAAGDNWCKDGHGYYETAKDYYNNTLTDNQRDIFNENSDFADAKLRLYYWAKANGDSFGSSEDHYVLSSARINIINPVIDNNGVVAIAVVIAMMTVTAIGAYFFLRKRKEQ